MFGTFEPRQAAGEGWVAGRGRGKASNSGRRGGRGGAGREDKEWMGGETKQARSAKENDVAHVRTYVRNLFWLAPRTWRTSPTYVHVRTYVRAHLTWLKAYVRTYIRRTHVRTSTCPYRCSSLRLAPSVEAAGGLRKMTPRGLGVRGLGVFGVPTEANERGEHGAGKGCGSGLAASLKILIMRGAGLGWKPPGDLDQTNNRRAPENETLCTATFSCPTGTRISSSFVQYDLDSVVSTYVHQKARDRLE